MGRLYRYYATYRSVGFARTDALRFAWLVTTSRVSHMPLAADPCR